MKYDIIGDVHGCAHELFALLNKLGYKKDSVGVRYHESRRAVFVGDLCDRGPYSATVLGMVKRMVEEDYALMVLGNHDDKLRRYLKGNKIKIAHGLQETIDSLARYKSEEFNQSIHDFLAHQPYKLSLDDGKLHVVHAAAPAKYQGELSGKKKKAQKAFALYGVTTGEIDENGYPVRVDWAQNYDGEAIVVHGHVAQLEPTRVNNVFNVDTACVFGNKLTALRYPELEFVSVKAEKSYREDPFLSPSN